MKEKEKLKNNSLLNLYFSYLFQKGTIIVIGLCLLFTFGFIFLCTNPQASNDEYLEASNEFHKIYFSQSLLIIMIQNSIIISSFVLQLTIFSSGFDCLFLSHVSRRKICFFKLLCISISLLILCIIEALMIISIGILRFPLLKLTYIHFVNFWYIYVGMIFEAMFSIFLITLIPVILTPLSVVLLSIVVKILCNNMENLVEKLSLVIPIVELDSKSLVYTANNILLSILWIFLLGILYISVYNVKDLKI